MSAVATRLLMIRQLATASAVRPFSSQKPTKPTTTTLTSTAPSSPKKQPKAAAAAVNDNVPGLSQKCVLPKSGPHGPGASTTGDYKVPEYFCYDKNSFAEAEIEMASFRCPQPNANRKL